MKRALCFVLILLLLGPCRAFAETGAPALSVVTEEKHFGGSVELLKSIALTAGIPVLRKDFITTKEELYITRDAGASAAK